MSAKLVSHQYGKSRVRVMKIIRDGATHTVKELDVAVALSGDFASSYLTDDNSKVVATDTMKNTVNAFASQHLGLETERFAATLAQHFITKYPQVQTATVTARERLWDRLTVSGAPHPHSFTGAQQAKPFTIVTASEGSVIVESGIAELLILKSTGSGFEGFPRCELTTLRETAERIFATSLTATWTWSREPVDYTAANRAILSAMLQPFALEYSPSVQATLFQMGEAALKAVPEVGGIHLSMPNKHCLPMDLTPLGLENRNEMFLPTDEPHGLIEATIARG